METGCLSSSCQSLNPHQRCTLKRLRMSKHRMHVPDGRNSYERNYFSEFWLFHLPPHRKALNSLTWDILFSLTDGDLLMFWLPGHYCKNSYISWILSYLFWTVSQSYLRGWVLGLNPQFCLPNKIWFSALGCAFIYFFLVDITLLRKVLEIGNILAKYFELNKLGEVREFERTVKKIFEWYIQYILTVNLNKIKTCSSLDGHLIVLKSKEVMPCLKLTQHCKSIVLQFKKW